MDETDLTKSIEAYQEFALRAQRYEERFANDPDEVIRQMGADAVEGAFDRVKETIGTEVADTLSGILQDHKVRLVKLNEAKQVNSEVGLSTAEVDAAIDSENSRLDNDPILQLALLVHTAGAPAVASTTEAPNPLELPKIETEVTETEATETGGGVEVKKDTVDIESDRTDLEKKEFVISCEINEDGPSFLIIGKKARKRIPLSRYWKDEISKSRQAETLAVAKVMIENQDDGLLIPLDIRELAVESLGRELDDTAVKRALKSLSDATYRDRQIFVFNGKNGRGAKYGVNPDTPYNVIAEIPDEDIRQLDTGAVNPARTAPKKSVKPNKRVSEEPKVELSEIDASLVNIEDFQLFMGLIDIRGVIGNPDLVFGDQSIITKRLERFIGKRQKWIDELNHVSNGESVTQSEEELAVRRVIASSKIFDLINDVETLDRAYESLADVYLDDGDNEAGAICSILESLREFSDDEKQLLKDIIEAQVDQKIIVDAGGWSRGAQIVGSETVFEIGGIRITISGDKIVSKESIKKPNQEQQHAETPVLDIDKLKKDIGQAIEQLEEAGVFGGALKVAGDTITAGQLRRIIPAGRMGTETSIKRLIADGVVNRKLKERHSKDFKLYAKEIVAMHMLNTYEKVIGNKGSKVVQRQALRVVEESVESYFKKLQKKLKIDK